MKALVCELCGGTEIVKEEGYFVCQSCGTKYTLEEAKKMMIEGTVDVKGTVKVDMSEKLSNYYQLARRAKDTGNNADAGKYYDLILQEQPDSWEATFYTTYFSCSQTTNAGIGNAVVRMHNTTSTVMNMIIEITDRDEQIRAVEEVATKASALFTSMHDAQYSFYKSIPFSQQGKYANSHTVAISNCFTALYTLGDTIKLRFPEKTYLASRLWKKGAELENGPANIYKSKENTVSSIIRNMNADKYDPTKI